MLTGLGGFGGGGCDTARRKSRALVCGGEGRRKAVPFVSVAGDAGVKGGGVSPPLLVWVWATPTLLIFFASSNFFAAWLLQCYFRYAIILLFSVMEYR